MSRIELAIARRLHRWAGTRLARSTDEDERAAAELRDLQVLERIYSLQSEQRQERRALESRAATTVAAALTSLAFAASAVSSRLEAGRPVAIALLIAGTAMLAVGVIATAVSLYGHSRLTTRPVRGLAEAARYLSLIGPPSVEVDQDHRSLRAALEARRAARISGEAAAVLRANQRVNAALARLRARSLPGGGNLPLDIAFLLLDGGGGTAGAEAPPAVPEEPAAEAPLDPAPAGERSDLAEVISLADQEAQRLQGENSALAVILRWTSLMLGVGVVCLVAGITLLLVEVPVPVVARATPVVHHQPAKPGSPGPPSSTTASAAVWTVTLSFTSE